jgi:alpha-L-rhamnosidase
MKRLLPFAAGLAASAFAAGASSARAVSPALAAGHLRCEYRENPVGLGTAVPRFNWQVASGRRAERQTAYQILVAGSEAALAQNRGDLWDTRKVASGQTTQIVYAGAPLRSGRRCYWKVRVWDRDGGDAGWSAPASFEIGLLSPDDWKAQWVTAAGSANAGNPFATARWIWTADESARPEAPIGTRYFRRAFTVPTGARVMSASVTLTADDQCRLFINGKPAGASGKEFESWKQARTVDIASLLLPGVNTVAIAATNTTVSPAGVLAALTVKFAGDQMPISLVTDGSWESNAEASARWQANVGNDPAWSHAKEIAAFGQGPWASQVRLGNVGGDDGGPARYLRHRFTLAKPIRQARLYATALGIYEPYVNGVRVGDDTFSPGWTDYHKRVQYETYDVTAQLHTGDNALGMALSDGWYAGHIGLVGRGVYGPTPLGSCQLRVDYTDGTSETIATDGSWRGSTAGPIVASDLQSGETYDARREMPDWSGAKFDDSSWPAVTVETGVTAVREADRGPIVKREQELPTRSIAQPAPGAYIFDLGQNMVGYARLKVKGPAGNTVRLRFAEMLNPNGSIYTANYRGARCIDEYTLRGDAKGETYDPHFTFRGFRYVEVTGWPGGKAPGKDAIIGVVIHSDTPRTGTMETSSAMVNKLLQNIDWGQRGNFLSVPTDCPQRDERLGWMGDAQIFVRTATYNRDVAAFFGKWLVDVDDAQTPDGAFTDVSPHVAAGAGTAAWGDAGVICPWTIYLAYGDTRILEDHYPAMTRWVDYCEKHSNGLLRPAAGYGDWLSIAANTPKDVLATAYFAYSTKLTANAARVLGKTEDAAKYDALFNQIKAAFDAAFVDADGQIKGATQTDDLLSLRFDLLPADQRAPIAAHLVRDIHAKGDHLSTGFVGVGYLCPTLTATGHTDVAYSLLNQDTFPSWGYSIKYGATTIWERWDGWTADKGFQTPGMNSFNHYSLGSVGEWLYSSVAGIAPDPVQPGYRHIIVHPLPGGGLTFAGADYDSIQGPIGSHWKFAGDQLLLDVTLPANTTATVYVPTANAAGVAESGKPAGKAEGVALLREETGYAVYEVQSGSYHFSSPQK